MNTNLKNAKSSPIRFHLIETNGQSEITQEMVLHIHNVPISEVHEQFVDFYQTMVDNWQSGGEWCVVQIIDETRVIVHVTQGDSKIERGDYPHARLFKLHGA